MRRLLAVMTAVGFFVPITAAQDTLTGSWRGDIEIPGQPLELVMWFEPDGEGGWTGSADTPAQDSWAIPWTSVDFDGGSLTASITLTQAIYEATLSEDGSTLQGLWKQGGGEFTLNAVKQPAMPPVPEAMAEQLTGNWEGPLDVGAMTLRLQVHIEKRAAGTLGGEVISVDQGNAKMAMPRIDYIKDRDVRMGLGVVNGYFDVTLADDGSTLDGTFTQMGQQFEITLTRAASFAPSLRPQTPQPPFPYREEEVSYHNEQGSVTIAGTLTLPEDDSAAPYPVALMITGSGPQDRNEEIFEHKPFLVIADHLTRHGIAVLRVDDRGVGGTTAGLNPGSATSFDFAGDVQAGVDYLKSRPDIDPAKIGLIGHSEGGLIAPIVAAERNDVAFIIMLAGPGVPGHEILVSQLQLILEASGEDAETIANTIQTQREVMDLVIDESLSLKDMQSKAQAAIESNPQLQELTAAQQEASVTTALSQISTPWVQTFARYDPAPTLRKVSCPVLAINGELDLQVPCDANLEAIELALKEGGNTDVTIKAFPKLNHLFQSCETGLITEYAQIEETMSVEVLDLMADWIAERFLQE